MRALNAQLAVLIRHPEDDKCAVDTRTLTVPAWEVPDNFRPKRTWESLSIELAKKATGSLRHSVDSRLVSGFEQTLYIMKRSEDDVLRPGYEWMDYSLEAVRKKYAEVKELPLGRKRDSLEQNAMQALGMFTLFKAIGTDRQDDVLLSWFCENPGMYGLDKVPEL
jgi:hypothetical protein